MNLALIDTQIRRHEQLAAETLRDAQYADGGAYSQDRDRAREHLTIAAEWRAIRRVVEQHTA